MEVSLERCRVMKLKELINNPDVKRPIFLTIAEEDKLELNGNTFL